MNTINKLEARGNRPLQMEFEHQLNALIYFHVVGKVGAASLHPEEILAFLDGGPGKIILLGDYANCKFE